MENFRRRGIILSVCGATFLGNFQNGAMTVALPTIQKALDISEASLQWPVSVYYLTNGCFLLVSGRLADIFGHRLLFLIGTAWFAVWSLVSAFSPNHTALVTFMALLGLGPALNTPAGIGILASNFEGKMKDQAFGALGAGQPLGYIFGLCIAGALCQSSASWRSVFYIQAGISILSVILGFVCLPKSGTSEDTAALKRFRRIDWLGAVLITAVLVLINLSLANSQTAPRGWRTPYIPTLLGVSVLILGVFITWERRREKYGQSTILPLSIFQAPHLGRLLVVVFAGWWSFNVLTYFATLYFQSVLLLNPVQTSIRFIPMAIAGTIISFAGGFFVGRVRPILLIMAGLTCCLAAAIIFALIDVRTSYWSMAFLVMITAPGLDLAYTVGNIQVIASVEKAHQALAGGIFNVATRIGTTVGLAVTSTIASTVSSHYLFSHQSISPLPDKPTSRPLSLSSPNVLLSGYRAAAWVCFSIAGIAMIPALLGLRSLKVLGSSSETITSESSPHENSVELDGIDNTNDIPLTNISSNVSVRAEQA